MGQIKRFRPSTSCFRNENGAADHRGAISRRIIRRSELHCNAGIDSRFGAGVSAWRSRTCDGADAWSAIVIKTELVLPVAVGNPGGHELGVLLAPERLAGVEGQTDRFAVQRGLGCGSGIAGGACDKRSVLVALRAVPASTTADREILHALGEEAEIHIVVNFDGPRGVEARIAINEAAGANQVIEEAALIERVVVDLLVRQRRYVEVALVGKVEGELQTGDEVTLRGSEEGILRLSVGTDLERNVMQR